MSEARLEAAEDRGIDVFGFVARFAPLLFLIVLMLLFAIMEPRFLSQINLFNVMRQVSITGLLAVGMTFVILTAGIDLSVGSLLAFAGLVARRRRQGRLGEPLHRRRRAASATAGSPPRSRRSQSVSPAAGCRASPSPGSRFRLSW